MNLASIQKKQQEKDQKEQAELAGKLVEVAGELLELLKSKDLKVFECDIVANLLARRIKETADGFVGDRKISELYAKEEKA